MDPVAMQKRLRMVVRRVPHRRVRITAAPGEDGGAIDHQVARADQALVQREAHHDHQQRFAQRRSRLRAALPLLGRAGDPRVPPRILGQTARLGQGRPGDQSVV